MRADERALPLSDAADAYLDCIPAGRFDAFPVTAVDRTGVPVWAVSHVGDDGVFRGGYGYGTTDEEAFVGALGELHEQLRSAEAVPRLSGRDGSWRELHGGGLEAVHPWACCPPAGSPVDADTPLRWVPATAIAGARRGTEVWVPVELVASSPRELPAGYRPCTTPITNGLGAHGTFAAAVEHGACEVVQRDGNGVVFRALEAGVAISGIEPADDYREAGIEVTARLAGTELGVANVYVTSAGPPQPGLPPIMWTACGEAADPDPGRALRKATLEYAASRARKAFSHLPLDEFPSVASDGYREMVVQLADPSKEERRALDAMVEWLGLDAATMQRRLADRVLPVTRHEPWAAVTEACQSPGTPVVDLLAAAGHEVLAVDLSGDGAAAAKVMVPGLEVETMSYRRIGERNVRRLLERDLGLVGLGPPPPGCLAVRLLDDAEQRLGGPAWYDPAAADRRIDGLYPLYREPSRHAAGIVAGARR